MKLINKIRLKELSSNGSEIIFGNHHDVEEYFLDEIRVGLTVESIAELPREIDFVSQDDLITCDINPDKCTIEKGKFYLATTKEKFSLPNNLIGIINTRSKFARIGLETVSSSWFVIPNFGKQAPTPLILEIKAFSTIKNVNFSNPVSYMLLFEIDKKIKPSKIKNYLNRFPFSIWQKK